MNSSLIALLLDEDESDQQHQLRITRRFVRNYAENFMDMSDKEFQRNFRLNKSAFLYIMEELKTELQPVVRSSSVSLESRLAACLRFLAEGGYQRGAAHDFHVAMCQSAFSRHLSTILEILDRKLCPKWIKLPMSAEEKQEAKRHFLAKTRIPGVIMCIDGTHIKIFKPSEDNHLFYNRKGFYSLNAMIICDHKMRIRYVSAKHPGACHDSYVWNNSDAATFFETAYRNGDNSRLLGDAGYPLQPWLLTPYRSTEEGTAQSRFNKALSKGRSQIERTFGVLKNRFRCLLGARQLHYAPEKAVMITNVCCALHNICLHYNTGTECVEFEDLAEEEETDDSEDSFTPQQDSRNNEANVIRETILASF